MKKYRALIPIGMVVLMLASWYTLISDTAQVNAEYDHYLSEARRFAEDGITKYAIQNYTSALEIKSSAELYAEVADYYKTQGKSAECLAWCRELFEAFPTHPLAYDYLLNAYVDAGDYESCYDVLNVAAKRNISSEYMDQVNAELMYTFRLDFNTYSDVGIYSNNYCAVNNKDRWGFVDRYGNLRVACSYPQVGAYTKINFVSVVNPKGEAFFIDKTGSKVMVSKEPYQKFGLLVNGIIAAQRMDGKYIYVNDKFSVLFGEYDYASTVNNHVAAVKNGAAWQLIDAQGNAITNQTYLDVKLDEKQIAFRNDRLFVSTAPGKYIMIDAAGTQIGSLTFEDAQIFSGAAPAAVKIDGRWCFIGADGSLISNHKYDDARSYANGLAAVCIDGKWGFVDLNEDVVIEPQFYSAKDFNEKGSCFVKTGDKWQLLKLYRLNREG
ncbi:MAG: WG repeat-containing protein [Ruminococcaceae bacterium]|nr:WG repeat-containing protein [Oscillospiraceae bacterium]